MMAVYSVEGTSDNIQLLMEKVKGTGPQSNRAEKHVERAEGKVYDKP